MQAVLQQRELRGLGVRVRAVAAVAWLNARFFFLSVCFGGRSVRQSDLRFFRYVFFNQESPLFGCCDPWTRGDITTANRQYTGPAAGVGGVISRQFLCDLRFGVVLGSWLAFDFSQPSPSAFASWWPSWFHSGLYPPLPTLPYISICLTQIFA